MKSGVKFADDSTNNNNRNDDESDSYENSSDDSDNEENKKKKQRDEFYSSRYIVTSSNVKLYTTSTKSHALITKHERRAMHFLNSKQIEYELIFVDVDPVKKKQMEIVSHSTSLPQLHINNNYYGDFVKLQDLEDRGELDLIFEQNGFNVYKKNKVTSSENLAEGFSKPDGKGDFVLTVDGALRAKATKKTIRLNWDAGPSLLAGYKHIDWLLIMDTDPLYIGSETEYVIHKPDSIQHTFILRAVDSEGNDLVATKPLGQITIGPPLRSGFMKAKATHDLIHLSWKNSEHIRKNGSWLLLLNNDPVYQGPEMEYVLKPKNGPYTFILRLVDENGKTDDQIFGEISISSNSWNSLPLQKNGNISSIVDLLERNKLPKSNLESSNLNVVGVNKGDNQSQTVASKIKACLLEIEQEKRDKIIIESAVGIAPPANASLHERNILIARRMKELQLHKDTTSEKIIELQNLVGKLGQESIDLLQAELRSRKKAIEEQDRELEELRQKLQECRDAVHMICRQLGTNDQKQIGEMVFTLLKSRDQLYLQLQQIKEENESLKIVCDATQQNLVENSEEDEELLKENEKLREELMKVIGKNNQLKTQVGAFEEGHAVLMAQMEQVTMSIQEQQKHRRLFNALNKMTHLVFLKK